MSWTDANKTDPQGDWGQAAENDIGYGQGADNAIGWGVAHVLSWGHAITNLFGKLSALTAGWDLLFQSNQTEPLNTANELIGTSGGGSYIAFADLTGITISSTVGTGALSISGNDMDFTTSGNIRKITVDDNGTTRYFLLTEGVGNIKSSDGVLSGTLNGVTWGLGVDTAIAEGTQTALMSFNNYDYFNGLQNIAIISTEGFSVDLINSVIQFDFTPTEITTQRVALEIQDYENNIVLMVICRPDGVVVFSVSTILNVGIGTWYTVPLAVNEIYKCTINITNSTTANVSVLNHTPISATYAYAVATRNQDWLSIGNRSVVNNPFIGVVLDLNINGTEYNTFNQWDNQIPTIWNRITPSPAFQKQVNPENPLNLGNDYFGQPIQRPLLTDGYNFSGQVGHYFDSAITLTSRNAADSDSFFIKPMTNAGGEFFAGDDVVTIGSNASNQLEIVWNGVTLTGTQVMTKGNWYLIQFGQDGALLGKVWKGTELVSPIVDVTGAVGAAISATTSMKYGNKDTSSTSFNGYMTQLTHYPKLLTDAEVIENWTILKSKAI